MKYSLDENGDLIENPESLTDKLKLEAPELADKLEGIWQWKQNFNAYKFFLYHFPAEQELDLEEKKGWENYIESIDAQIGLKNALEGIELLKNSKMDITNDKVIVVRSDRPFFDTILKKGEKIGEAEGWVGLVDSYGITDIEGAEFCSHDGKVYKRFILRNARKLSEEELQGWAFNNLEFAMNHHFTEGIDNFIKKMAISSLGNETIQIYDKYPNIDHCILKHELKEDEKQVAHISYEEAEYIDILPFYGSKQIPHSQLILIKTYPDDNSKDNIVFMGADERKISEIYAELQEIFENKINEQFNENLGITDSHLYVAKFVKNFITPEQKKKIENAPLKDVNKWCKKFIDEQGLEITDKTLIGVQGWHKSSIDEKASFELFDLFGEILVPKGYKKTEICLSYGWNAHCQGRLSINTTFDFGKGSGSLYAGELIIVKNSNLL